MAILQTIESFVSLGRGRRRRFAGLLARLAVACAGLAFSYGCDLDLLFREVVGPKLGSGLEISTLESTHTGTNYSIYVSLPDSYGSSPSTIYPLFICLDGDYYLPRSAALALAKEDKIREPIIVGIGYGAGKNERSRDLTPTRTSLMKPRQTSRREEARPFWPSSAKS